MVIVKPFFAAHYNYLSCTEKRAKSKKKGAKITSCEQKSNEQQAKGNEQQAKSSASCRINPNVCLAFVLDKSKI